MPTQHPIQQQRTQISPMGLASFIDQPLPLTGQRKLGAAAPEIVTMPLPIRARPSVQTQPAPMTTRPPVRFNGGSCGSPPSVQYGIVVSTSVVGAWAKSKPGDVVEYACLPGYEPLSYRNLYTCTAPAMIWIGDAGCRPKSELPPATMMPPQYFPQQTSPFYRN